MAYIIIIVASTLLIALVNILCGAFSLAWWVLLIESIVATIAVIAVDGITASIIRHLPEKWFSYEKKIFQVSKKEVEFYKRIGIKKWKDKVPELGGFTSFHKNKVQDPKSSEYLERFLLEIDYGWIIHIVSVFTGALIILLDYGMYMGRGITVGLTIGIPVIVINGILNLLPAFILRFNFPRLKKVLIITKRNK